MEISSEPRPHRLCAAGLVQLGPTVLVLDEVMSGGRRWSLPGGGVEPGETFRAALRREFVEELGMEPARIAPEPCGTYTRLTSEGVRAVTVVFRTGLPTNDPTHYQLEATTRDATWLDTAALQDQSETVEPGLLGFLIQQAPTNDVCQR
jgi:8-oxo-dGTP pyrophosphatase MutT (NUDIX family)